MNKINWTVRIRNKSFWISIIPAFILLIQAVAEAIGFSIELGDVGNRLITVVNAVFTVLTILGIVNDPTTVGIQDSEQAMTYLIPKGGRLR